MSDVEAASTPETEQAGSTSGKGLAAAISSAFDEVGIQDDDFAPAAVKVGPQPKTGDDQTGDEAATSDKPVTEEGKEPPAATAPDSLEPPAAWTADQKGEFAKLPDEGKKILLALAKSQQAGFTKSTQEVAEDRKFAATIRSLFTPEHQQQLKQAGLNETQGLQRLLQYQDYAFRKPADYVKWFIGTAKLNPADLFPDIAGAKPPGQQQPTSQQQPGQQPQPRPAPDPTIAKMQTAVESITGWISEFQQQQTETQERQALDTIARFRDAKDDKGSLIRPHFAAVEDVMTNLLISDPSLVSIPDPQEKLQRAYEAAVHLNPETRAQIIEDEIRKRGTASRRQADIDKARKATPPIPSSPAQASGSQVAASSLKDRVAQSMKELGL